MPGAFQIVTYHAWRRLFGAVALFALLCAALFGAHTPGVGYDDDDPNRLSLVADYPKLALNNTTLRRADAWLQSAGPRLSAPATEDGGGGPVLPVDAPLASIDAVYELPASAPRDRAAAYRPRAPPALA